MSKQKDTPGNAAASQAAYGSAMINKAGRLQRFEVIADRYFEEGIYIQSVTIRLNYRGEGGVLVIIRADSEAGKIVSFTDGGDLLDGIHGAVARLENRSIHWKEDKYG